MILPLLLPVAFGVWFLTAPAGMAVQRIAAGTGRGPIAILIIHAADWYESPMLYLDKIPSLRRVTDPLEDRWCEILAAPETTP